MAIQTRGKAVHAANLGLYLDRPPLLVPERGLSAGINFRIENGQITNRNVGWSDFNNLNLDSKPVTLIKEFEPTGGVRSLILGNTTDLFRYFNSNLTYLTPRHDSTGETVAVTNGSATVTGTSTTWITDGIKAGDFFALGADVDSTTATWYEVQTVDSETQITLTANYAEATQSGQAYTIRRVFTGTVFDPFLDDIFPNGSNHDSGSDGDRWYATNGVDGVVAWDGATTQVYFPTFSFQTCKALRRFKNAMVYLAPTVAGSLLAGDIITSAIGQPENDGTLEAAQFTVADDVDPLIAAYQIGELLAVYSERAVIMAQFVGAPIHFVFRTAIHNRGAISARSIVRFPSQHYFRSTDGTYVFDGVAARHFSPHVWKELTRASSPNRKQLAQAVVDEGTAEIVWVTPLNSDADPDAGAPEHAYVSHYLEEVGDFPMAHSARDLPATATGTFLTQSVLTFDQLTEAFNTYSIKWNDQQLQQAFPQVLFGDVNGNIWQLNNQNQDTTVPTCFVRFSRRPLVDSRRNGVVKRVYPNAETLASSMDQMTVKIRLFDSANSLDVASEAEYNVTLDGSDRFAPFRNSGRFVEVEMGSGPSVPGLWAVEGYDMDTVPGGER